MQRNLQYGKLLHIYHQWTQNEVKMKIVPINPKDKKGIETCTIGEEVELGEGYEKRLLSKLVFLEVFRSGRLYVDKQDVKMAVASSKTQTILNL